MILLFPVCAVGLALFLWPFAGAGLPSETPALAIGLGALAGLLCLELGTRRMDSRQFALLAALSAADAALRAALVTGIGGFSPIFLLVLCGGYALGPTFGFLVGASSLLVSALDPGGLGHGFPYQLFAVGWVGMAAGVAGMLRRGRRPSWVDVAILAAVGAVAGFGFGAVMDVWNWTFYPSLAQLGWSPSLPPLTGLSHFLRYYAVTSAGYDAFRAAGNVLMVAVFSLPVLAGLRRLARRFQIHWPAGGDPAPAMAPLETPGPA